MVTGTVNSASVGKYDKELSMDVKDSYDEWKKKEEPQYEGSHQSAINKAREMLENREFSYDVNTDEAYLKYRDSVKNSAELALADAMGNAAALNGGYATSYAQLAGQAEYRNTMKSADEKVLDLYKEAYDRFLDETENIEDYLEILLEMDDTEWDRYVDMLDAYNEEGEVLFDQLREISDEEFDRFYSLYKLSKK